MSIGTINSNSVTAENIQEQECCSLDVYCTIVFTPLSLSKPQMYLLKQTKETSTAKLQWKVSYIGDIHCQRIIYDNCAHPTGDVIEGVKTIVVDCSDLSTQLYLDEIAVRSKITLARVALQNLVYKFIGHQVTFHLSVISFTLTEDIAKCFAYKLSPDECLLPEDIGLLCQLDNSLNYQLNVPCHSRINLDFVINYDTFPVIFSGTTNLTKSGTLSAESGNMTDNEASIRTQCTSSKATINDNEGSCDESETNINDESSLLLKGGVSMSVYSEQEVPEHPSSIDFLERSLYPINPVSAMIYSANKSFVNYIQTEEGKIWWKDISKNIHLASELTKDNANNLSGWLFNAAIGGYVLAGTIMAGSGFVATPASAIIATCSSLILFGSGVAATISTIATVVDSYTYIYDYISDPIENDTALNKAYDNGIREIKNYVISKITGGAAKKIGSKFIKQNTKTREENIDQLRRQERLRENDVAALNKKEAELGQLELKEGNPSNYSKRKVSSPTNSKKYKTKRQKLLNAQKNIRKDIERRDRNIEGLRNDIFIDTVEAQSSSTLEDIFSNIAGGVSNKMDSDIPDNE